MRVRESFFAGKVSKEVTEELWKCNKGVLAYKYAAIVFMMCGAIWGIMAAFSIYFFRVYWLLFVALMNFMPGLILFILCNNSKKFCAWANENFMKSKKKYVMSSRKRDAIALIVSSLSMIILFGVLFFVMSLEGK